jgi:chitinase
MNALMPGSLLYASAVKEQPTLFAELQTNFDQINVTTYELAGPWPGYVTWHNSPIYSNGTFPDPPHNPLPSIHEYVQRFLAAGVPPGKLGLGIMFQGKHWLGVTLPGEAWTQPPVVEDIPFSDIMNCYYVEDKPTKPGNYHWDEQAQAAYLSIKNSPWIKDCFISFDDETAIQKKIDYAGQYHLGVFIWELGGGWRLGGGPHPGHGLPDYLLRFVKDCTRFVHDSPLIEPDPDPPDRPLE